MWAKFIRAVGREQQRQEKPQNNSGEGKLGWVWLCGDGSGPCAHSRSTPFNKSNCKQQVSQENSFTIDRLGVIWVQAGTKNWRLYFLIGIYPWQKHNPHVLCALTCVGAVSNNWIHNISSNTEQINDGCDSHCILCCLVQWQQNLQVTFLYSLGLQVCGASELCVQ